MAIESDNEVMSVPNTVCERIRTYVYKQFPIAARKKVADGDALLDSGVVDSLGILEIVNFLEQEFGIRVNDDELVPENFNSIASLNRFVEDKMSS
jgi:acyl carrier protein